MQNRRTEVTQTGQTRLSEEPTVPAASVEEASGCLVYRGGRAIRTGQAGEWTHPTSASLPCEAPFPTPAAATSPSSREGQ